MHYITFSVRYLGHTNTKGLRLKVTCSAADKTATYGFYGCENDNGTFESRNAEHNAVTRYVRDILPKEQPHMVLNESTIRQLPNPAAKGDSLFMMEATYKGK